MSDLHSPEQRLHPLSILFNIARHVRDLIVPLGISALASRSEQILLIGSILLASGSLVSAVWTWFTYRFRYGDEELIVISGKIFRNERHIPYNRIQNIDAVQNVVHRVFEVAVVQVQTGSGSEPEATMKVLPLSALAEMRQRIFAERSAQAEAITSADAANAPVATTTATSRPRPVRLVHLPPGELLLAGLIENRGMALILAAIAMLSRFDAVEDMFAERVARWIPEWAVANPDAAIASRIGGMLITGAVVLVFVLLFVRVLSTVWAFIRLYDFQLVRDGDDLRAEYGLFTRVTSTIPVKRVQTVSLHRKFLHRRLGRAAIRVTTAGHAGAADGGAQRRDREWLAPIIRVEHVVPLLRQVDESISFDDIDWRMAHPAAKWRMFRVSFVWSAVIVAAASLFVGWWSAPLGLALLVRAMARSRGVARNLGAAMADGRAFFRSGWFEHITTVVRFERMQSTGFRETLFDRRTGMATVSVDSAGTGSGALRMPYLPREEAVVLHRKLAEASVATPFVW